MSGTSKCIFVANCLRKFELCLLDLSILVRAVFSTRAPPPKSAASLFFQKQGWNKLWPKKKFTWQKWKGFPRKLFIPFHIKNVSCLTPLFPTFWQKIISPHPTLNIYQWLLCSCTSEVQSDILFFYHNLNYFNERKSLLNKIKDRDVSLFNRADKNLTDI